ncbi:MAG: hypothetical protein H0S80_01805 [Desulfovibrionaceae bacterium]|nr:hypothetical protein [Desulfovibrionaceae bacterium]
MPFIKVETNVAVSDASACTRRLSALAADMLGKPESYVLAVLEPEKHLLFGGSDDPAAYVTLDSFSPPEARTGEFSAAICAFMEGELKVPGNRVYIVFGVIERHLFSWGSRTF